MLIVAKNIARRGFGFGVSRKVAKKVMGGRAQREGKLEDDVFKAYRGQVEKGSILRQFREEVFRRAELNEDWADMQKKDRIQYRRMQQLLKGESKQESIKNSTKIESRLLNKRTIFDENNSTSLLSDYGNYSAYNQVYPVIEDRNLGEGQFLQQESATANLYKFIDKLPEDYEEKISIRDQIRELPISEQNISIAEFGRRIQDKFNQAQEHGAKFNEMQKIHVKPKMMNTDGIFGDSLNNGVSLRNTYTGTDKLIDPKKLKEGVDATLSPHAVDTIYELYLQGWSVRQISKRFGILPARTKFCVWVRAQLYHEVLPKLGVKYYLRALKYEKSYNEQQVFCDYGLDLEALTNDNILYEIYEWNNDLMDAQRQEHKYLGAMFELEQEKKFNKYQMVEVGTLGREHAKYRLKQWHIFRGKGSDHHFLKFNTFKTLTKAQRKFNKVYY